MWQERIVIWFHLKNKTVKWKTQRVPQSQSEADPRNQEEEKKTKKKKKERKKK